MELIEAVKTRKSIRSFKPDPVPKEVLEIILENAVMAPSWANTQPWEFAVVSGELLERIKKGLMEKGDAEASMDVPRPQGFPEKYMNRMQALAKKELDLLGIKREDKEGRGWWRTQNFNNYGAPCVIYLLIDRYFYYQSAGVNSWPVFDCGLVAENIMLLAAGHGLGTIAQAQAVAYPDVLRRVLEIDESRLFLLGIACGYPNWDDKIAHFRSDKEPLSRTAQWFGFDQGLNRASFHA
ncbi:MAG: nitroreductase [Dehalococcoidales bacterium]|nr:nitroreductase [Dehalococcoidales bacterium]